MKLHNFKKGLGENLYSFLVIEKIGYRANIYNKKYAFYTVIFWLFLSFDNVLFTFNYFNVFIFLRN
jgi:hypothetical protein